jgi:hypothetical protein
MGRFLCALGIGHFNVVDLLSWMAMDDTAPLTCPYCFENVEVYIDPQSEGELIRDCDVCCRPWSLQVSRGVDGELFVRANRAQ